MCFVTHLAMEEPLGATVHRDVDVTLARHVTGLMVCHIVKLLV